MKKLFYNIYSNLTDEEYRQIESRLIAIEQKIISLLKPSRWKMTLPVVKNDALFIDFTIAADFMMGNLGVHYVDKPGVPCFSFYLTKSFDTKTHRYFTRTILVENESLSFFDDNVVQTVEQALSLYKSWNKEYIERTGIVVEFS